VGGSPRGTYYCAAVRAAPQQQGRGRNAALLLLDSGPAWPANYMKFSVLSLPCSTGCFCVCRDEEEAARALQGMQGRYYAGKPIVVEFSPVTDFREATCRQYEENNCSRGGYCNFMHVRPVSRDLRKQVRAAC
jgi:hypothetical protein